MDVTQARNEVRRAGAHPRLRFGAAAKNSLHRHFTTQAMQIKPATPSLHSPATPARPAATAPASSAAPAFGELLKAARASDAAGAPPSAARATPST